EELDARAPGNPGRADAPAERRVALVLGGEPVDIHVVHAAAQRELESRRVEKVAAVAEARGGAQIDILRAVVLERASHIGEMLGAEEAIVVAAEEPRGVRLELLVAAPLHLG